jgi:predicted RNA binding protein with dsRBD fold (UPF0201 family)
LKKDLMGCNRPDDEKTQKAVLSVLTKLESGLSEIDKSVNKLKLDVNVPEVDLSKVIQASKETTKAINSLVFPVANFRAQEIIDAIENISISAPDGGATEATLAKTVGFDKNADLTGSITTVGAVTTIVKTDGVKTLTKTIDETVPTAIATSEVWS